MKKIYPLTVLILFCCLQMTHAQIYHEDDKEGLRIFLRQPSAVAGKINAEQLGLQISDTINWHDNENWVSKVYGIIWNDNTPKQLIEIRWISGHLAGILNASKWTKLQFLSCGDNQLTALIISANIELQTLWCSNNQLTELDLSKNTKLKDLTCYKNQLTTLDLSANTELLDLSCQGNKLTELNLIDLELQYLLCSNNQLSRLDIGTNKKLREINCHNNQLKDFNTSTMNTELRYIDCSNNLLTQLEFTNLDNLYLDCSNNQLTQLELNNVNSSTLNCSNNQLTLLDINNVSYLNLDCSNNYLTELDLSVNQMWKLSCYTNHLLLSNLFELSELLLKNPPMIGTGDFSNQTLPAQTVVLGKKIIFPVPQNVLNGTYTEYTVTQNGIPAAESDYTVTDGEITFNKLGNYSVTMTNNAIMPKLNGSVIFDVIVKEVGIEEIENNSKIIIYPNPTNSYVTVMHDKLRKLNIEIFDITGKMLSVYPCTGTTTVIDVSHLHTGIYFVRTDGKVAKLIKY